MKAMLVASFFVAFASAASAQEASPAPIIAAERAFAADAAERGWAGAFRRAAAPEAIMLAPDPVNAHERLAQVEGDGETTLDWRPAYAGVARSGDLGFTTGPFLFRGQDGVVGHYFTIWRRQPDGGWKWIFDAGTGVRDVTAPVASDAAIPTLPLAAGGSASTAAAMDAVRAIEAGLAGEPNGGALADWLTDDAHLNRPGAPPAIGADARTLARAWDTLDYDAPLRIEGSEAGDLVFVLGPARWRDGETERTGHYARVWQLQSVGWRVVFDEIVPRRGG